MSWKIKKAKKDKKRFQLEHERLMENARHKILEDKEEERLLKKACTKIEEDKLTLQLLSSNKSCHYYVKPLHLHQLLDRIKIIDKIN